MISCIIHFYKVNYNDNDIYDDRLDCQNVIYVFHFELQFIDKSDLPCKNMMFLFFIFYFYFSRQKHIHILWVHLCLEFKLQTVQMYVDPYSDHFHWRCENFFVQQGRIVHRSGLKNEKKKILLFYLKGENYGRYIRKL